MSHGKYKAVLVASFLALVSLGCSDPTLVALDPESLTKSSDAIRRSLEHEDRIEFDRALKVAISIHSSAATGQIQFAQLHDTIGGMTSEQLITYAARLRAEQLVTASQQRFKAIRRSVLYESDAAERSRFSLTGAQWTRTYLFTTIDYEVRNLTSETVTAFTMDIEYRIPIRAVPHFRTQVTEEIPGGLEPGETRKFSRTILASRETNVSNAEFFGHTWELRGVNGEPIFSTRLTLAEAELARDATDLERRLATLDLIRGGLLDRERMPIIERDKSEHEIPSLLDVVEQMPRVHDR